MKVLCMGSVQVTALQTPSPLSVHCLFRFSNINESSIILPVMVHFLTFLTSVSISNSVSILLSDTKNYTGDYALHNILMIRMIGRVDK